MTTSPQPSVASIRQPHAAKLGWKISCQHYTYRRFSVFEALDLGAKAGLQYYEIRTDLRLDTNRPGMNANENMPDDARRELKARVADAGLSIPSVFADFNGEPDQARKLMECWKDFGVDAIVAEPPAGSYDMLEKLCDEYQMRIALHNHQKGQSNYWSPDIVLEVCKGRGPRMGACADVGQWVRSDLDPVECLRKLEGRIVNFHMKDVQKKGDLQSPNTVIGQGVADCGATLAEIKRQGYRGVVAIDFEHDTPALQEDMARNIAFIEDTAKRLLGA